MLLAAYELYDGYSLPDIPALGWVQSSLRGAAEDDSEAETEASVEAAAVDAVGSQDPHCSVGC